MKTYMKKIRECVRTLQSIQLGTNNFATSMDAVQLVSQLSFFTTDALRNVNCQISVRNVPGSN